MLPDIPYGPPRRPPDTEPAMDFEPDLEPSAPAFSRGDRIGRVYHVMHQIRGGMSDVYLCFGPGVDFTALKFPRPKDPSRGRMEEYELFLREVRPWTELNSHPHVVDCLSAGTDRDRWYLVLEWVAAPNIPRDLYSLVELPATTDRADGEREIIKVAAEVCDGLAHIHSCGIVHSDLKPANVLLDQNGSAKITDLGMASSMPPRARRGWRFGRRATSGGARRGGTYLYKAPELWTDHPPTVQSDIYALGCVLYELVNGQPVFDSSDVDALWQMHRDHTPPKAGSVHQGLDRLITECLEKRRSRRPTSAAELRDRLDAMLEPCDRMANRPTDDHAAGEGLYEVGRRVTLLAAAGRLDDAITEQTRVIRYNLKSGLGKVRKQMDDEPDTLLATSFNDRGGLRAADPQKLLPAIADFHVAVRLAPGLAVAHANLGTAFLQWGLVSFALAAYSRAIEIDPEDYRLILLRARLHASQGWHDSARSDFQRSLSLLKPEDSAQCGAMAEALFGLGRGEEGERLRAMSRDMGGSAELERYLSRPLHPRVDNQTVTGNLKAHLNSDHAGAIELFNSAIEGFPRSLSPRYSRAESRLEIGDPHGALEDLDFVFTYAASTDPRLRKAYDLRRRVAEQLGEDVEVAETLPQARSSVYLARRLGVSVSPEELAHWAPLSVRQRHALLDMLHAGPPDRHLRAQRLLPEAFQEHIDHRTESYQARMRGIPTSQAQQTARDFAQSEALTEIALRSGLGSPAMLTDVQVTWNGIDEVRFVNDDQPTVAWRSADEAGLWSVAPGYEAHRLSPLPGVGVVGIARDGSANVVAKGNMLAILDRTEDATAPGWYLPPDSSVISAHIQADGSVVAVLSDGAIFLAGRDAGTQLIQIADAEGSYAVTVASDDDDVTAYVRGLAYRLIRVDHQGGQPSHFQTLAAPALPPHLPCLALDGQRAILRSSPDQLLLAKFGETTPVDLSVADGADDEGITCAAASLDGCTIAAACGSYLYVWVGGSEESQGFLEFPRTPQQRAQCIAVSHAGEYIVIGTELGSLVVYETQRGQEGRDRDEYH